MGRIAGLMPEVVEVVRRFPVAVLCCVWAFVFNAYWSTEFGRGLSEPITLGLMAAFFGGGAAHLFAEASKWTLVPSVVFAAVVAVVTGYLAYDPALLQSHLLFLFLGLALTLFVSPYVRRNAEQGAVWLFGMRLALAALLALVVGLILMLGLFAIVNGLKFLFGFDLGNSAWERISALSIYLVGPLFGLAMVPRNLDEVIDLAAHKGGLLERGVSVLVNYIAVPLAIIYALLLHAYAAKIIALQSMPKGEVGLTVTLFAIAGTFAWLVAWPLRETGTRLLKLYSRYWFWFLPVPVVLLALAVWQRVGEHGMTPDRYGLILVALWAALVCGYLMLRRSYADMRVIIGGAAVLLVLGSFGPLGAVGLTISSHFGRFEKFLTANGMLEKGRLKAVLPELSPGQKLEGQSLLRVLQQVQAINRAAVFLPESEKLESENENIYVSDKDVQRFGLALAPIKVVKKLPDPPILLPQFSFRSYLEPISFPFSGEGRVVGPLQYPTCCYSAGDRRPKFLRENGIVTMTIAEGQGEPALKLSFVEGDVLKAIKEASSITESGHRLPLSLAVDGKTLLVITGGSGDYSDAKVELTSLSFWVVVQK
jgi:hypothetical protein